MTTKEIAATKRRARKRVEAFTRDERHAVIDFISHIVEDTYDLLAVIESLEAALKKQYAVPLTDAEVLKKLPAFITTVSGKPLSEEHMTALIEELRWA